jgi:hypothetical protein
MDREKREWWRYEALGEEVMGRKARVKSKRCGVPVSSTPRQDARTSPQRTGSDVSVLELNSSS